MTKPKFILNNVTFPNDAILKCLETIVQNQNIENVVIELNHGTQNGDNYMGYIYTAEIIGQDSLTNEPKTLNLIVKTSPFEGALKDFTPMNEIYRREICMYNEYLPYLYQIQERFNLNLLNPVARLYASSFIDSDEYLIMENLKADRFCLRNRQEPLDLEHCRMFMEQLGYLHALSLVFKYENKSKFLELANRVTDKHIFKVNDMDMMKQQNLMINEKALKTIDPLTEPEIYRRFQNYLKGAFETLEELAKPDLVDEISIITHGDCWTNNFLWKYTNGKPSSLVFLDWQASRYGSPVYDISYFMYNCTDRCLRDEHFNSLINHYHQSASNLISSCGYSSTELYPKVLLDQHIQKYFRYGISMCLHTVNIFLTDTEELPNVREIRVVDSKEMDRWNCEKKNHSAYVKRMHDIVVHAVSNNFI